MDVVTGTKILLFMYKSELNLHVAVPIVKISKGWLKWL
jgi:hypothetical protein